MLGAQIKKNRLKSLFFLASQEGLEPPTPNLEGSCSIRMSYWLMAHCSDPVPRPKNKTNHFQ